MSVKVSKLKGLGPKTEKYLNNIGIFTRDDLETIGAVSAYLKLIESGQTIPHLSFLYALVGALEDRSWLDIANNEKERLLYELEGLDELRKLENDLE